MVHATRSSVGVRTGSRRGVMAQTERTTLTVTRSEKTETTTRYIPSTATRYGR